MSVQAPINFSNSEFYGFSEFFYCTEDVLRLGGQYDSHKYSGAAAVRHASLLLLSLFLFCALTGFVCLVFSAGVLRHQVVDAETASGQQAVLSARRHQQSQVSESECRVSQHGGSADPSAHPPPTHTHRYQCFKSAWMYEVLHSGFRFPGNYLSLKTAQLVYDKEVQWTLGAILFKTRFLPLR